MNKKKNIIYSIITIAIAFLTIKTIFSQNKSLSIAGLWDMLSDAHDGWLFITFLSMFGFILFEGLAIQYILNSLGYKTGVFNGLLYSASDQFFSAITPSASGGQPASALFMKLCRIPASAVTVCLITNLVMYTLSTAVIGILSILLNPGVLARFDTVSKVFIFYGIIMMGLLSLMFYILLCKSSFMRRTITAVITILSRLHIIRDKNKWLGKLDRQMAEYKLCSGILQKKASVLICVFILNMLQRFSQISVTPLLNCAIKKTSLSESINLWCVQALSQIGSNCVPIPGGMGVADYLMLNGFQSLFTENYSYMLQTLSRSISFYICTLLSGIIGCIGYAIIIIKKHKENS